MSSEERTAWYKAALMTIGDMPEAILAQACAEARKRCDHPAKIVPFICDAESKIQKPWLTTWAWMKRRLNDERRRVENLNAPKLESPKYVTAADFAELRVELTASLSAQE
jgi:hypothetical protein